MNYVAWTTRFSSYVRGDDESKHNLVSRADFVAFALPAELADRTEKSVDILHIYL